VSKDQFRDIATKALTAAGFFFILQQVVMKAPLEISLGWALCMGVGAGLLAWTQHRRGT
jgi:hypothetical protein